MTRSSQVSVLIGERNTGKTTKLKKLISKIPRALIFPANMLDPAWKDYEKIKPIRGWKIDPRDPKGKKEIPVFGLKDYNGWTGHKVVDIDGLTNDEKKELYYTCINVNHFRNGAIVTDDMRNMIATKGTLPNAIEQALGNCRHTATDFFFAAHALNLINGELVTHLNNLYLSRSKRPPTKSVEEKFGTEHYNRLMEMYHRVNKVGALEGGNQYYCELFQFEGEG